MSRSSRRIPEPVTNPERFMCKIVKRLERDANNVSNYFNRPVCDICMDDCICKEMPMHCSHKLCKLCYFKLDVCPYCRTPFKKTIMVDLSDKHILTEKDISFPVLARWAKANVETVIRNVVDIADEITGCDELNDELIMKSCRRINVYLNRHVFAKVCFVIDEEIIPQWVVGVGGVLLNEMDHITVDPIEKKQSNPSLVLYERSD
jgi:hypothetical protein